MHLDADAFKCMRFSMHLDADANRFYCSSACLSRSDAKYLAINGSVSPSHLRRKRRGGSLLSMLPGRVHTEQGPTCDPPLMHARETGTPHLACRFVTIPRLANYPGEGCCDYPLSATLPCLPVCWADRLCKTNLFLTRQKWEATFPWGGFRESSCKTW